jgi:hypothetical protein
MACVYVKIMVTVVVGFTGKARIVYLGEENTGTEAETAKDVIGVWVLVQMVFCILKSESGR